MLRVALDRGSKTDIVIKLAIIRHATGTAETVWVELGVSQAVDLEGAPAGLVLRCGSLRAALEALVERPIVIKAVPTLGWRTSSAIKLVTFSPVVMTLVTVDQSTLVSCIELP